MYSFKSSDVNLAFVHCALLRRLLDSLQVLALGALVVNFSACRQSIIDRELI